MTKRAKKTSRKKQVGANDSNDNGGFRGDRLSRLTAPPELEDEDNRKRWRLAEGPDGRGPYMVELNVQYVDGLGGAAAAFVELFEKAVKKGQKEDVWRLVKVSKSYYRCEMKMSEWRDLIVADEERARKDAKGQADDTQYRTIYKLWPDFPVEVRITRSVATIKADAALRSFEATGDSMCWAVIDSGVEGEHPHFGANADSKLDPVPDHSLLDSSVRNLHRCFVDVDDGPLLDPDEEVVAGPAISRQERDNRIKLHLKHALRDPLGHGSHVAGIIAGRVPNATETVLLEREDRIMPGQENENLPKRKKVTKPRVVADARQKERYHGVAPGCRIVSLRVLDQNGVGRSSNIVRALEYIREKLNDNPKMLRIHGVNLSVGYEFDAEMFACGQSPLCSEVNRLVQAGVVVVTAAGNTGYSALTANNRVTKVGLSNTINDPGNAELAITVGSTHREAPHTFGVSYFSSKGPTGDGRMKPDLVAPGERIVSCAAGRKKDEALAQIENGAGASGPAPTGGTSAPVRAYYVEDSGTSMAAPHVSGAIAAFLSIRREFIGRPLDVKRIFLESAMPLGRERYFEGHGLIDLMRAIQSV